MKARLERGSLFAVLLVGFVSVVASTVPHPVIALQASPGASPTAGGKTFDVTGLVETPGRFSVADLQTLPIETTAVTFELDGSEQYHTYTGVRLWDLVSQAKPLLDPTHKNDLIRKYLVLTANDGYEVVISLGEIAPETGGQPYLLAWEEDGAPLPDDKDPIQLVTPGDTTSDRYIWGIVTIEIRDVDSPRRT
jgi:DMSO/TMAO reductase YedYZ molybdopterin-dependent catalytic subunit